MTWSNMTSLLTAAFENYLLRNWSGTVAVRAEKCFEPASVEEIRKILALARVNRKNVKVIGSGYSFSDLPMTKDYIIRLNKLDCVIEVDPEKHTVTAQAGIKLTNLSESLYEHGLSFSVLPVVTDITLGGAISTGAHGSGVNYGSMSSYVLELELVTAAGEVIRLTRADDGDMFRAACLSIGALGVITSVKMQCEPKFDLTVVSFGLKLQDLLENLAVHTSASDHFMFCIYPHTEHATLHHYRRSIQARTKPGGVLSRLFLFLMSQLFHHLAQCLLWISSFIPSVIPYMNHMFYRLHKSRREFTGRSDKVFLLNLTNQVAYEWAVPRDKAALVVYELNKMIVECKIPAHFPIVGRFSKADDLLLSPASNRDVCYINVCSNIPYGKTLDQKSFFRDFGQLMAEAGGSVHWGKNTDLTYTEIRGMYPGLEKFREIREKLDPDGLFVNPCLKRLLGLE